MKPIFLLPFLLAASFAIRAQQPAMKVNFSKTKQVQLVSGFQLLHEEQNMKSYRKHLRKSDRFTDAEVDEIIRRLTDISYQPPAMGKVGYASPYTAAAPHYVAYEQNDFSFFGYDFSLVWIPKNENAHMPAELQPPKPEGFVFYTYTKKISRDGKDAEGRALAKAGTPVFTGSVAADGKSGVTAEGVQWSKSDVNIFEQPTSNQGVIILYYTRYKNDVDDVRIWELRGKRVTNQSGLADLLNQKSVGLSRYLTGYEYLGPGYDCGSAKAHVNRKMGRKKNDVDISSCVGQYSIE